MTHGGEEALRKRRDLSDSLLDGVVDLEPAEECLTRQASYPGFDKPFGSPI